MFKSEILGVGKPEGIAEADLGETVQKSGRTTGYTKGRIIQVDVTTSVMYGGRISLTFPGNSMADGMSAPGDSGSIVLNENKHVVWLLFAGSQYHNPY